MAHQVIKAHRIDTRRGRGLTCQHLPPAEAVTSCQGSHELVYSAYLCHVPWRNPATPQVPCGRRNCHSYYHFCHFSADVFIRSNLQGFSFDVQLENKARSNEILLICMLPWLTTQYFTTVLKLSQNHLSPPGPLILAPSFLFNSAPKTLPKASSV